MKRLLLLLLTLAPCLAIGQVADIDGNTYQTIQIGIQEWMVENLRTSKYSNGDIIPNITSNNNWSNLSTGAWCHYNNDNQYDSLYGKIYNWYTIDDSRNLCPSGWQVPSYSQWKILAKKLDSNLDTSVMYFESLIAGGTMKSMGNIQAGTGLWKAPNTGATNSISFTAHPSGNRSETGLFSNVLDEVGVWWSTSSDSTNHVGNVWLWHDNAKLNGFFDIKEFGYSVRCLNKTTFIDTTASSIIDPIKTQPKHLLNIYDLLGRTTHPAPNTLLFYIYDDGSVEKKMLLDD